MNTEDILGYRVTVQSIDDCVNQIQDWLSKGEQSHYFVCANPHSIQIAEVRSQFQSALKSADMIIPDGIGVVLASKILQGKIKGRVTGSDIFWRLSKALNKKGGSRYFFLGSTDEVLMQIKDKMAVDFPGIEVVGLYSPPFKNEFNDEDNHRMINAINNSYPDVLWVGMTAPKQEIWIYENKNKLNVKVIGAIGAVLDFYVENVKRSHPVFQSIGLEWLPRLLQEPRRLWHRNLISNPMFMLRVLQERLKRYGRNNEL